MTKRVLTGELRQRADELYAAERVVERLVAGLDDAAFNWRSRPSRWSIAQCLTHLSLTARVYLPAIDDAIAVARAGGLVAPGPYRHGLVGTLLVRALEPPVRVRLRVPLPAIAPASEAPLDEARAIYEATHDELRQRLAAADGLDLGRARLRSPLSRYVTLSLGQAFAVLTAHERRHLWQAERVRAEAGFPGRTSGPDGPDGPAVASGRT
ncbi:MAG TPA: DinB family protein [Gemmatimonadales bacterium]|nr:DinB family protein [Gemmatimonadales bacterium]